MKRLFLSTYFLISHNFFPFVFLTFQPVCTCRHYLHPFDVVQGRPVRGAGRGFIAPGL